MIVVRREERKKRWIYILKLKDRSSKSVFTLIELLVVVAIIAVLIAILLPSLVKAREKALQTMCMAQIKSIGLAHELYKQDYGKYPFLSMRDMGDQQPVWGMLIWPYVGKSAKSFQCPSNKVEPAPWIVTNGHWGLSSYGVNMRLIDSVDTDSDLDGHRGGRSPSEVSRPGEKIAVVEAHLSGNAITWSTVAGWCYNPGFMFGYKLGELATGIGNLGMYHSGGANYGFTDGHAEWIYMNGKMSKWVLDHPYKPSEANPWVVKK